MNPNSYLWSEVREVILKKYLKTRRGESGMSYVQKRDSWIYFSHFTCAIMRLESLSKSSEVMRRTIHYHFTGTSFCLQKQLDGFDITSSTWGSLNEPSLRKEVVGLEETHKGMQELYESFAMQHEEFLALTSKQRTAYLDAFDEAWQRSYILGQENVQFPRFEDYATAPRRSIAPEDSDR